MYRMFVTSPEVLRSMAFAHAVGGLQQHARSTLQEQKLKVLNFLWNEQQMLLCWELF